MNQTASAEPTEPEPYLSIFDWGSGLIDRQATLQQRSLWAFAHKVYLERELWLAVMSAQADLGLNLPSEGLDAYRQVVQQGQAAVDIGSIRQRELVTHHDVKARLEEFNDLAGYQLAHLGMTGRDLDDNLELYLQRRSLELLAEQLAEKGRESVSADISRLARKVRFRGIVGAVGTGQDQLQLFNGNVNALHDLNARVASHLGFPAYAQLDAVGQVYPRSLDYMHVSSLAATLSTVVPQGRRSPFPVLMRGYASMLAELAGDQWAEGDVSCSSVRRVALPGAYLAASAHVQLLLTNR